MSNYFNNKPFKPTKVGVIKAMGKKIGSLIKGKGKVSPTIKSVSPSTTVKEKGVAASVKKAKSDEYRKRYTALDEAESKVKTGKKMMQEGQKERKKMVDTGRAFQFRHGKSFHAINPGEKDVDKSLIKVAGPQKKFQKGKELREKKMGGGMMGRRMNYKAGSKPDFLDLDKDGNTSESMKQAAKQAKKK
tara:strand:- start:3 stop:569 length:567 start_codon:yes stop_codon:yes gene_type:complete